MHFADHDILTPGDAPDVLVAMNPPPEGQPRRPAPRREIIVNTDEFTKRNLAKVGYREPPRRRHAGPSRCTRWR
jgi:2-oxoglutarate ferredoxin oxidoreductase subunit alpha